MNEWQTITGIVAEATKLLLDVFPETILLDTCLNTMIGGTDRLELGAAAYLPGGYTIWLCIDAKYTRAHLIVPDGAEQPENVAKDTFLDNTSWTDFQGWVSVARKVYDDAGPHTIVVKPITIGENREAVGARIQAAESMLGEAIGKRTGVAVEVKGEAQPKSIHDPLTKQQVDALGTMMGIKGNP